MGGEKVTSVAGRRYAVDRLDECLKEVRSGDPDVRRVEHMIIAAMKNGLGVSRTPSVRIQEFTDPQDDPVAYRFRDRELDIDWAYAPADDLDPELMEEKGWEVQPLTVLEEEDE